MKWKFWEKKEEAPPEMPMPRDLGPQDMSMPRDMQPPGMEGLGMPQPTPGITEPPFTPAESVPSAHPRPMQPQGMSTEQQLQLISSKLDTLKAQMDVVLQRLERMEHTKEQSPYQQRWNQGM